MWVCDTKQTGCYSESLEYLYTFVLTQQLSLASADAFVNPWDTLVYQLCVLDVCFSKCTKPLMRTVKKWFPSKWGILWSGVYFESAFFNKVLKYLSQTQSHSMNINMDYLCSFGSLGNFHRLVGVCRRHECQRQRPKWCCVVTLFLGQNRHDTTF